MLLAKLDRLLDRFPWLLPVIGFASGCSSFILVQRGNELAKITAAIVLAGWVWVLLLPIVGKYMEAFANQRLSNLMSVFVSQSIQQEILFFSLPFLLLSTSFEDPGQIIFSGLVALAALVSSLDPVYEKYIASNRMSSIAFHSICSFVAALVVLPIVVQIPLEKSFYVSLSFVAAWLFIAAPATLLSKASGRQKAAKVLFALCIPILLILSRSHIPPAGVYVSKARITAAVENHEPGAILTSLHVDDLERGLYAYSSISAPRGVKQEVVFHWKHANYSEQIVSEITGGREEGFRTYSFKENFIDQAEGEWTVDITTAQGQLLERLTFYVYG